MGFGGGRNSQTPCALCTCQGLTTMPQGRLFKGKLAHNFNGITLIRNYHIVLLEGYTNSQKKNRYKTIA